MRDTGIVAVAPERKRSERETVKTPTFHTIALKDTVWARWRNAWRPAIVIAYTRKYVRVDLTTGKRRQASKIAWENLAWRREDLSGADNPAQMELLV